jgi:hypothetical protein
LRAGLMIERTLRVGLMVEITMRAGLKIGRTLRVGLMAVRTLRAGLMVERTHREDDECSSHNQEHIDRSSVCTGAGRVPMTPINIVSKTERFCVNVILF